MDLDDCICGHSVHVHRWKDDWPCTECGCTALSIPEDYDRATAPPVRWWRFQRGPSR